MLELVISLMIMSLLKQTLIFDVQRRNDSSLGKSSGSKNTAVRARIKEHNVLPSSNREKSKISHCMGQEDQNVLEDCYSLRLQSRFQRWQRHLILEKVNSWLILVRLHSILVDTSVRHQSPCI